MAGKAEGQYRTPEHVRDQHFRYANMHVISFRLGEGSRDQQYRVLRYVKGRHPDLKITPGAYPVVKRFSTDLIYDLFFPNGLPQDTRNPLAEGSPYHTNRTKTGGTQIKDGIDDEISTTLTVMKEIFNKPPERPETLIPSITNFLLAKDYHYLVNPGEGRPKMLGSDTSKSFFDDPWGSFFVHFVMRGHKTGVPEFNEMFTDIKKFIQNQRGEKPNPWTDRFGSIIDTIVEGHNTHHSDDQFENEHRFAILATG